jgi:CubicO group peptidase (beta-lactamase class C family)
VNRSTSRGVSPSLPTETPETVGLSSGRLSLIDEHLQAAVDAKILPGAVALVARHGKVAYFGSFGMIDIEDDRPMRRDAVFRIASMTKPIVSTAIMMLYEDGRFRLSDPISKYIPEFSGPKVLVSADGDHAGHEMESAGREITITDLLTHTSGIGYSMWSEELRPIYRQAGVSDGLDNRGTTIAERMRILGGLPLANHPGSQFLYGLNADVLGYLVEIVSGDSLKKFLTERILSPLIMADTHFHLPEQDVERMPVLYSGLDAGQLRPYNQEMMEQIFPYSSPDYPNEGARTYFSGGWGLSSTAADYFRFSQMLLNGGELEGTRLLDTPTVEMMTASQIGPLNAWGEKFGFGFQVLKESTAESLSASPGTYGWMGYWGTRFWIDPLKELIVIFMSQVKPSDYDSDVPRALAYEAMAELGG